MLVYADHWAIDRGEAPLEIIDFVVDTTGHTTVVELHDPEATEEYYCYNCSLSGVGVGLREFETVIKIMKNGDFTMVSSVENEFSNRTANITISGHVDKDTGRGTFEMEGTVITNSECNITIETSGEVIPDYEEIMRVGKEYYNNPKKYREKGAKSYLYFTHVNSNKQNIRLVTCAAYYFNTCKTDDPEYTGSYEYFNFCGQTVFNHPIPTPGPEPAPDDIWSVD